MRAINFAFHRNGKWDTKKATTKNKKKAKICWFVIRKGLFMIFIWSHLHICLANGTLFASVSEVNRTVCDAKRQISSVHLNWLNIACFLTRKVRIASIRHFEKCRIYNMVHGRLSSGFGLVENWNHRQCRIGRFATHPVSFFYCINYDFHTFVNPVAWQWHYSNQYCSNHNVAAVAENIIKWYTLARKSHFSSIHTVSGNLTRQKPI